MIRDEPQRTLASLLALPQVWLPCSAVLALAIRAYRTKCLPQTDHFVEIIAYGMELYGARQLVGEALSTHAPETAVWEMVGAILLAYVAGRGIWRTLTHRSQPEPPIATPRDV